MRNRELLAVVGLALVLPGCNGDEEPRRIEPEQKGREETRLIRNTESIGYSGEAIADKVDGALDASEEHEARMKQQIEEQE